MSFKRHLDELVAPSSPELQTQQTRLAARDASRVSRGLTQGRKIDISDKLTTIKQPMTIQQTPSPTDNIEDVSDESTIIKNNAMELIYVIKDDNKNLFITFVNKQKMTKRTLSLDARGAMLLKRYI